MIQQCLPTSKSLMRLAFSIALSISTLTPVSAAPKTDQQLAREALMAHLRTSDDTKLQRAILDGPSSAVRKSAASPSKHVQITVIFKAGITPERLVSLSNQFDLDILHTDAKVPIGDSGEAYTVLTLHPPVPREELEAQLLLSEKSVVPAMRETATLNASRPARDLVQTTSQSVGKLKYYSASAISSFQNVAALAQLAEVMTVVVDDEASPSIAEKLLERKKTSLNPVRHAQAQKFLASAKAQQKTTSTKPITRPTGAVTMSSSGGGDGGPAQPDWFGPFDQDASAEGDPDAYKIDIFPDSFYYGCNASISGYACPNDWTWIPRFSRVWRIGVTRYQGGCYLLPSFYWNWTDNDDVWNPPSVGFVEVCEQPQTTGSIVSQFKFNSRNKTIPGQGSTNLYLAAYHATLAAECDPGPTGGGVGLFEYACDSDNVDAVYVEDSTFEDETHIVNANCQVTLRSPGRTNSPGCFNVYQVFSNLPAAYLDTPLADAGYEFKPTVGSANAAAFTASSTYRTYIYFAASGLQYLAGTEAMHEFEIGTYEFGQSCAPWCVFKVKEKEVGRALFAPVMPVALSFSNISGTSAKANWTNASAEDGVNNYEWRINGGSWSSTSASPLIMTGLSPTTTYNFEVRAKDTANTPGPAATGSFTTPVSISISNRSVGVGGYPFVTQATYWLTNTGDVMTTNGNNTGQLDVGDWISPKTGMSNYQVRRSAGNCNGPPINQWIQLNTDVPPHLSSTLT
jgi:hypothetical protein